MSIYTILLYEPHLLSLHFADVIAVDCVDGITQEVSGKELLIFISGSDHEPPLGFHQEGHLFQR